MKLRDNSTQIIKLYILLISVLLSGCSSNSLYFGTSTTIGLNVSGTETVPSKVAIAFEREEIAIVPNKADSQAHSVFGALDANLTWFNGQVIKQIFATGEAAIYSAEAAAKKPDNSNGMPTDLTDVVTNPTELPDVVTNSTDLPDVVTNPTELPDVVTNSTDLPDVVTNSTELPDVVTNPTELPDVVTNSTELPDVVTNSTDLTNVVTNPDKEKKPSRLYFGTRTTLGIGLSFGNASGQTSGEPFNMVLGYNRKEATIIPVNRSSNKEANSVYADISIVHSQPTTVIAAEEMEIDKKYVPKKSGGVRISTKFATGEAAIALTKEPMSPANANLMKAVLGMDDLPEDILEAQQEGVIRKKVAAMSSEEFDSFIIWCKMTFPAVATTHDEFTQAEFNVGTLPAIGTIDGSIQTIYTYLISMM